MLKAIWDFIFPWEYLNVSTPLGMYGAHFSCFRRHKHTQQWQGSYFSGGLAGETWLNLGADEVKDLDLEEALARQ